MRVTAMKASCTGERRTQTTGRRAKQASGEGAQQQQQRQRQQQQQQQQQQEPAGKGWSSACAYWAFHDHCKQQQLMQQHQK
jgi:hypothetical protein